jgi:hypothetical protein
MNHKRLVGLGVALVLSVPFLAACGAERSTEAFCEAYNDEKDKYLEQYGGEPADGWAAVGNLVGAMSAWVPMFDRMAEHAPEEIRADVEHIRDSLKQQQETAGDSAGDPLGGLISGLWSGLMTMDSWNRLGEFVEANCVTEQEMQIREARAAEAEAAAKAEEDAYKTAQAEDNARATIEWLSTELNYDGGKIDTSSLDNGLANFEYYLDEVEIALSEAEESVNDPYHQDLEEWYCDDPPWAYTVEWARSNAEYAKNEAEAFDSSYYLDTGYLSDLVREGETAVGDLGRRVPDSPMVNTLQNMLEDTRGRITEMDELNAAAQAEADALAAKVAEFVPKVEAITAEGDARLGC